MKGVQHILLFYRRRVKTTSIGSLSDYMSETESVFSLSNSDLGLGKARRRKSQGPAHSSHQSLSRSFTTLSSMKDELKGQKGEGEFQVTWTL